MKHVILAGALVLACGLGTTQAAQRSGAPPATDYVSQGTTIEGCLRAGSAEGEFIVSTAAERHTVVAGQGVDLAAHLNHRVQLTGAIEKAASGPVFRATALKMIATACAAR